ncbi:unnamed protein product [Paramecium primaurelia]|uniref:Uncharacterized protein n=1 Tax=Paramecium primaurelia TaxID=5886 RepID=A0A8S1LGW9_PARPR|nr:unnamed protein product [Paramecium primaurelia]
MGTQSQKQQQPKPQDKYSQNGQEQLQPNQDRNEHKNNNLIQHVDEKDASKQQQQLQEQSEISREVDELQKDVIEKLNELDLAMEEFINKINKNPQQDQE